MVMRQRRGGLGTGGEDHILPHLPSSSFLRRHLIEGAAATVKGAGVGLGLEVKT